VSWLRRTSKSRLRAVSIFCSKFRKDAATAGLVASVASVSNTLLAASIILAIIEKRTAGVCDRIETTLSSPALRSRIA